MKFILRRGTTNTAGSVAIMRPSPVSYDIYGLATNPKEKDARACTNILPLNINTPGLIRTTPLSYGLSLMKFSDVCPIQYKS